MSYLNWINTYNTRDLANSVLTEENKIKPYRFIRSDAPLKIDEDEKTFLLENNIKTVIDLRDFRTVHEKPNAFMDDERFSSYVYPLSTLHLDDLDSEEDMINSYIFMLKNESVVAKVLRVMAKADGGILFHCQGGKDRTGLIASILMLLAGVSDEEIMKDYLASNKYLEYILKKTPKDIPEYLALCKPAYLMSTLNYIRDWYGGIEEYLFIIGLTENEIEKLKNKLLK